MLSPPWNLPDEIMQLHLLVLLLRLFNMLKTANKQTGFWAYANYLFLLYNTAANL